MSQRGQDTTIKVTACRSVYSGVNKRGDSYTIYEIEATKMDGQKINEKLRSFTALPIGQTVEVTVVPFNSERHGRSFTLQPKGRSGGGSTTEQLNELREGLEEAYSRIAKLSERVAALEGTAMTQMRQETPAPSDVQQRAAANFGDDPGF